MPNGGDDMLLFKSRYTPGLKNGKGVYFEKGEKVRYRMRDGTEYDIIIDSELMNNSGYWGFEAIFPDGRYFAADEGIIDWDGKDSNQHDAYKEALENIPEVVFDYNDNTEEKMDTLGKEFTEEKTTKKKKIIIILSAVLSCIALITVSALITHKISYNKGYDIGHKTGHTEGYNSGNPDGYSEGYNKGYDDGNSDGYDEGYKKGKSDGYSSGKFDGYNDGYSKGNTDGYSSGKSDGYNSGYDSGYKSGSSNSSSNSNTRTCREPGCKNPRFSTRCSYCEYHKCAIPSCNSGASYNSFYCYLHD